MLWNGRLIIKAVFLQKIETDQDVAEGARFLANLDPRFAICLQQTGDLPLRRSEDGFARLFSAIISQQVSVAAGNAIWKRLETAKLTGPRKVLAATEDELRACGLSRPKVKYAKALAEARIDYPTLRSASTEEVIATLTQVLGIGVWSAEIYAMASLGHKDVFPAGDLALQEAARILFDLPERPNEKQMRVMAQTWSPWRSVAARALWAYYKVEKNRQGVR